MHSRDYRDMVGGGLLVVAGLGFAWYGHANYAMGSIRHMGPAMFPVALGVMLAGLGLALLIPALFRPGPRADIRVWSPLFVLAGVSTFALTIRPFGLLPAIAATVVVSSMAELKVRPFSLAMLTLFLCVLSWLVFRVGLGMRLPLANWPF